MARTAAPVDTEMASSTVSTALLSLVLHACWAVMFWTVKVGSFCKPHHVTGRPLLLRKARSCTTAEEQKSARKVSLKDAKVPL